MKNIVALKYLSPLQIFFQSNSFNVDRKNLTRYLSLAFALLLVFASMNLYAQTTYFSRSPGGNWNNAATWSTVAYDNPTNAGTFPVAGDFVFIGGTGSTVTITGAAAACATLDIADNSILNVGNGLTVSGTTTVGGGNSGVLSINSATGTKLFIGLVTINNGATWNETVNEAIVFRGGITNNGVFSADIGTHTFNTNSQTLTGTFTIPSVTVTGGAVVLTNNNSLTVNTALSGTGRITQGAGATLNIGGTSAITNMTATASGNTVNYTGAAQTVNSNAYDNLGLSGSGIKTLQAGTTAITGDLILSGTVSTTGVTGMTIGGDLNIGSGTSFTSGAFTHNVGGDFTNNGTFTGTGSTIIFDGAAQNITGGSTTFNDVTLSGSGTKTFSVSPTLAIAGTFSINNGVIANLSNANTHTSNALILGGAIQQLGTWGSTSSAATNQNDTFFSGIGLITVATGANTYYSIASTAWNVNTTWSNVGFGGPAAAGTPGPSDFVFIGGGFSVTIAGAETCSALLFDAGTSVTNTLTISSGSLTVSGAVTIPQTVTSGSNILNVGGGTLTASSLDFTSTPGGAGQFMIISTGTATISGNVTGIGASSTIQFTGTGLLQVGGSMFTSANGTLTSVAGSTVEYNGAAQTVQALGYSNLTLSGSGTKTLAANTTVGGNLAIGDGVTFTIGAFTFAVTGTTTVGAGTTGTLSIASATGTKTFTGLVTINNGATWTNTTEAVTFQGGITNNGTFTAGTGVHTFNTNSQTLTGTFTIPSVTVTGGAVVLTNTNTLTVGTALSGTGRITQGAGATLNIGGTSAITNMTATASGNTVNYTGAAQTVHSNAYDNLGLSGGGVKTLQAGTTAITGDLILSGTVSTTGVTGMTIGGDVNIGSGTSFTSGAFTHNVGGDFTNNGTFTGTGSTIIFTGAGQNITGGSTTFNDVTLSGSGTKTFGVSPTLAIGGTLSINNGVIADLSNANTHTSNALILGGAIQQLGTWGSTSSSPAAANQNDTFFSGTGLITVATGANTYYSIASTAWNVNTTWSNVGFGGAPAAGTPGAGDFVYIGDGFSVTIAGAETCDALFFDAGTSVTNTLTISSGSLTVSGAVTIPQTVTSGSNILNVGAGTLTASSLDFTSTPGGAGQFMIISTGTATISGNITGIGASSTIQFTGTGLLQVGGSMFTSANGTLTSVAGSTVEYNGAAQTVQALAYSNLTLSGSGTKTLATPATTTTVSGNLTIADGTTFSIGSITSLSISGTTTVGAGTSGTLLITSTAGTKTFTGLVTVNTGALWNETANEAVTFQGGITNNGTFTAGTGVHTFNTNSQTLTGIFSIPNVTVTGAAIVLTNTNALTVGTALSGTGGITQGAGATLNIGGTSAITNMIATASGNTVNYTGAAQTVHNNTYDNLGLSGSGVKTLQLGTTAITGDFILSGTVSATGVIGMTIGGDVNIGSGTSFTSGAFTHNVGGDWTNNGTFVGTASGAINLNGAGQNITGGSTTFNDLVLSGSGTKVFGISTTIMDGLSINTGVVADLGIFTTHTANTLTLGGVLQTTGTWGSSGSAAANQNDTFFLIASSGEIAIAVGGNTFYSIASTAWNVNTTWSNTGFGGLPAVGTPGAGDFVYIGGGFTVTIAGAETCGELFFDAGTSVTNTLTISSGSLTVSGTVTIPQTVTSGSNIMNVGAGTLTAGDIDFTTTGSGAGHQMTISTGTATVIGNITGIGSSSTIQFTGAGLLQVGGLMFTSANGTLTSVAGSTVEYNGAAQTVQALAYSNLTLSGSGTKTLATPATTTTVSGNLVIADGVNFSIGAITSLSISGTTTVGGGTSGTLSITSTTGTKTFTGLVTVNTGGLWNETVNEAVTFQGGITNNGTFTAGTGVHTFNTNSQTLTGTFTIPNVTVTGVAVVVTNTNTLTVGTALSGTGGITQGAGATLNIGGASAITNMTATASGNTVNYTGAAQTVHSNNYVNLGLSGSGAKTLQAGTTAITGNLVLSGTVSTTGVTGLTIGGNVNIGAGTTFSSGAFDHTIGGDWINDGTFNHNNRLITFSGTSTQSIQGVSATTFYNLRIEDGPASPDVQLDQTAGVNLVGEMTFEDNAIFDADGTGSETFTVISTVTGDGRIGPLGGTADVTGNVTVQRYMDAEGKIYRYISTPVDNPTAEDLQGEIPITGPFTGSSFPPQTGCTNCAPCTGCVLNNTSMYRYEETIVAALNNRYTPFPSSGGINSETMLPGRGYAVYVRNDVSATTWDLRAELNKGEVDLNPSITGSNDGFNLVGNPYASPIDWESASWTRNGGIDPTIYIWDNSISNYASYTIGGGSTNGGSRYIAMGQAFWVLASGTPDLRAQEGIKANQGSVAQAEFFRVAKPVDNLRIKLIASNSSDEVLIRLNQNGASANFDVRMDALEFPSDTLLSLHSITTDKKQLAVNVLGPQQKNTTEIQLGLSGVKSGSFTIDFLEFTNFSAQTKVYLLDRFTDDLMEIQLANKQYSFGVTSDPASAGDKRFVVYLTRNGEKPEMSSDFEAGISVFPNPTTDKITVQVKSQERVSAGVLNALGIQVTESIELVKSGTKSVGQFDMSAMAPGVYILQIKSGRNIVNQRIVKK